MLPRIAFELILQKIFNAVAVTTTTTTTPSTPSITTTTATTGSSNTTCFPRAYQAVVSPSRSSSSNSGGEGTNGLGLEGGGGRKRATMRVPPHGFFDPLRRGGSRQSSSTSSIDTDMHHNSKKQLRQRQLQLPLQRQQQQQQQQQKQQRQPFSSLALQEYKTQLCILLSSQAQTKQEEKERQQMITQDKTTVFLTKCQNDKEKVEDKEEDFEKPFAFEMFPHFTDETYPPFNLRLKSMVCIDICLYIHVKIVFLYSSML
jgi:hypothetical protein